MSGYTSVYTVDHCKSVCLGSGSCKGFFYKLYDYYTGGTIPKGYCRFTSMVTDQEADTSVDHHHLTTTSSSSWSYYSKNANIPARKAAVFAPALGDLAADTAKPALFTKREYRRYVDAQTNCIGASLFHATDATLDSATGTNNQYLSKTSSTCTRLPIYAAGGANSVHADLGTCLKAAKKVIANAVSVFWRADSCYAHYGSDCSATHSLLDGGLSKSGFIKFVVNAGACVQRAAATS
jgi:hypothetical protein